MPRPSSLLLAALSGLLALSPHADAQTPAPRKRLPAVKLTETPVQHEERVYKTTPQGELKLHLSLPADWKVSDKRPAIVFFFGGGWKNGNYTQFMAQSDYFASRGLVAASADYRISSLHHTTPDKCVEDAKSAVRYLRQHAAELGIDTAKVIASGGSAGGHIAACTAFVPDFNADTDDKSMSAVPDALVLFNPALNFDELMVKNDTSPEDKKKAEALTPLHFLKAGAPPAIFFFGTSDALKKGADEYLTLAKPLGLHAELWTATGQGHSFFNRPPWLQLTTKKADEFLAALGYLQEAPTIKTPEGGRS